ncbi:tumor necrosis factor receptor superfamily member 14-like [Dromiciops gliroides]|uniref:tumor necrosis factor receptor superfamily member 14-like n=1 Tax=Dromiciops gliroides TaxID=33562 RepID=UPI001CC550BB|nr:tumor necrosis factor receptor superfamily member 14-like [Dromiciops gliroides]
MVKQVCFLMFSMVIITQLIPFMEALECEAGKYKVDGQCCPPCHAGFRLNMSCDIRKPTMCVLCNPGTYTARQNVMKECLQCKVCDPALGLVTRRECSPTSDTVCSCAPGFFCRNMRDDDCQKCMVHRVCNPGQYVKSRGTKRNNTICEKCPAGTFSPNGTLHYCLPWTNCSTQGLSEEKPGTDTTDALCSSQSNLGYKSIPICITGIMHVICIVVTTGVIDIIGIMCTIVMVIYCFYDIGGTEEPLFINLFSRVKLGTGHPQGQPSPVLQEPKAVAGRSKPQHP